MRPPATEPVLLYRFSPQGCYVEFLDPRRARTRTRHRRFPKSFRSHSCPVTPTGHPPPLPFSASFSRRFILSISLVSSASFNAECRISQPSYELTILRIIHDEFQLFRDWDCEAYRNIQRCSIRKFPMESLIRSEFQIFAVRYKFKKEINNIEDVKNVYFA